MADLSKIILPDSLELTLKDNSQIYSDHRHYEKDIVPILHKKYESTNFYGSTNTWEASSWYFASVVPDSWYLPWKIRFRVHTYCPNYIAYESITDAMITGRSDSMSYANWNELQSAAHYYTVWYPLKQAGFTAGYGHAIGISIYGAGGYTNSSYYRTFEIDYIECENCTVTFLDTPVLWADWSGTGTTNYGSRAYGNAYSRGLQETGDTDTSTSNRIANFPGKTGAKGIWATSLFMEDVNGTYENICTASDGTVTSSNRTTATTKKANTTGFKVLGTIYYTNTTYAANTTISTSGTVWTAYGLFDSRYAFNTELAVDSLTTFKELYLVGTIHSDGLFYLDETWWTQTPNDTSKIYVLVGACWDSNTTYCRITLYEQNKWYRYDGTQLIEIANDARTVNGHTVSADILGIDTAPTSGSSNLVTSGGAYTALSNKMDKENPVGSGFFSMNRKSGSTVGLRSTTFGNNNEASGTNSLAEGGTTKASGTNSHAEGTSTTASGENAHAEGFVTIANNKQAHAEGESSKATGINSHAEGYNTQATGKQTHTEGKDTEAQGENSHAEGEGTIAYGKNQHISGKYNISDYSSQYAEIIGNGSSNSRRSNARTLDWDGNEWVAGSISADGGFVGDLTGNASTVNNHTVAADVPSGAVFTDTKNTAGSTDTSSKIYLIGATEQAANPQTYSDDEVYATSGIVTTKSIQVGGGAASMQYNTTTKAVDFIFT